MDSPIGCAFLAAAALTFAALKLWVMRLGAIGAGQSRRNGRL